MFLVFSFCCAESYSDHLSSLRPEGPGIAAWTPSALSLLPQADQKTVSNLWCGSLPSGLPWGLVNVQIKILGFKIWQTALLGVLWCFLEFSDWLCHPGKFPLPGGVAVRVFLGCKCLSFSTERGFSSLEELLLFSLDHVCGCIIIYGKGLCPGLKGRSGRLSVPHACKYCFLNIVH